MKFTLTITPEVIQRSMYCGTPLAKGSIIHNCAFAVAFNELVSGVEVLGHYTKFLTGGIVTRVFHSLEIIKFIEDFDELAPFPWRRQELIGQTFEVEIPDDVINYHYNDHVKLAQAIANAPSLKLVEI